MKLNIFFYRADNITLEKTKNMSANQRRKYLFLKIKLYNTEVLFLH